MPTRAIVVMVFAIGLLAGAADARADINVTGFVGTTTTPGSRGAVGLAGGVGILIVAFEFEYCAVSEDAADGSPSLKTAMFNGIVQTPFVIKRLQFYGTLGAGPYHESLGDYGRTNYGIDYGGGVKISIAGPLRARVDYRFFDLRGSARVPNLQRLYAGLMLSF